MADAEPEPEQPPWRSEQIAIAAAVLTIASPIAFIVLGWIAGAVLAAAAAAAAMLLVLSVRIERGELERRAREAERSLQSERDGKARFLSVLSHDLRQPIHALSLYTAALNKRVEGEEARGILDKIDRAGQASAELISRVESYARFTAKTITPTIETTPLQPILDEVAKNYPKVIAPKDDHVVRTDPKLFRVILDRLAENAERYAGGGRMEVAEDGDELIVSVIDEGAGIAVTDQERMFDEFVRLDGARRADGIGLGLGIARRIAKLLNTDVRVKSAPGEGARFSISAPLVS